MLPACSSRATPTASPARSTRSASPAPARSSPTATPRRCRTCSSAPRSRCGSQGCSIRTSAARRAHSPRASAVPAQRVPREARRRAAAGTRAFGPRRAEGTRDFAAAWGRTPGESAALVGTLDPGKMEFAARLLAALPQPLRESVRRVDGARAVMLALLLAEPEEAMRSQLDAIGNAAIAAQARASAARAWPGPRVSPS